MNEQNAALKQERVVFIDVARSIAIIMMLQGHFISLTFQNYQSFHRTLLERGTSGNLFFDLWDILRGLTAPLFFTITGVVFVYLLLKNETVNAPGLSFQNPRVKKGVKRAFIILLWGYLLQINLKYIGYYLRGHSSSEWFAFHILQCIALGLLCLILLYLLCCWMKKRHLSLIYFTAGTGLFLLDPYFLNFSVQDYFPEHAPRIIQNIFHGPKSHFPVVPWLGFVLFGGMFGSLLHRYQQHLKTKWLPLVCMIGGVSLFFFSRGLYHFINFLLQSPQIGDHGSEEDPTWLFDRLAEVILFLSLLLMFVPRFNWGNSLFIKMGQKTLPIYIAHVIILYGAIIGYSLKDILQSELNGWQSILGALAFVFMFAYFIKLFEWVQNRFKVKKNPFME
jgi:uncharacterized membrane protein